MKSESDMGARETPAVATHSVRPDQPERPPLAVSDADVDAFHAVLFSRPGHFEHVPVLPITNDEHGRIWRESLRRAIAADRAHVAGRGTV